MMAVSSRLRIITLLLTNASNAFHWSDPGGQLKSRWDNASHWRKIPTFPHHKHVRHEKNVEASTEVTLADVLAYIKQNQSTSKNNESN